VPQIAWSDVRIKDVTDDAGRKFNWSKLKGKTIHLCGHGAHLFKDGYCAVAAATTVNFYQTYGKAMINFHAMDFIKGANTKLVLERRFCAGQGCPDMTLFDDDDSELTRTTEALKHRIGTEPDHYVFNTNQFTGLPVYQEAHHHPFNGKQILRLSAIMDVLGGNTFEWMCCQDLMGWRKYAVSNGQDRQTVLQQLESADRAPGLQALERQKRFSEKVQKALKAAFSVRDAIEGGFNSQGDRGFFGFIGQSGHSEGAGSTRYVPAQFLNKFRVGIALKPDPQNRAGLPVDAEAKVKAAKLTLRQNLPVWQEAIRTGLSALNTDPQPNTSMEERFWAQKTMEQALRTAGNLLESTRVT